MRDMKRTNKIETVPSSINTLEAGLRGRSFIGRTKRCDYLRLQFQTWEDGETIEQQEVVVVVEEEEEEEEEGRRSVK